MDGHAPGVLGRDLQAYAAAGIRSDHEAFTAEEGRERLRAGLWVLIREASAARNLRALVPLVAEFGPGRLAFCTDDREPEHIAQDGHVNAIVRDAVALGVSAADALTMASHHAALWHGLEHLGAVAPGLPGRPARAPGPRALPAGPRAQARPPRRDDSGDAGAGVGAPQRAAAAGPGSERFRIPWEGGPARVIGLVPGQILTDALVEEPRHVGRGGRGGRRPATSRRSPSSSAISGPGASASASCAGSASREARFASTFAHDAHNLVVVGMSDADMAAAVAAGG